MLNPAALLGQECESDECAGDDLERHEHQGDPDAGRHSGFFLGGHERFTSFGRRGGNLIVWIFGGTGPEPCA